LRRAVCRRPFLFASGAACVKSPFGSSAGSNFELVEKSRTEVEKFWMLARSRYAFSSLDKLGRLEGYSNRTEGMLIGLIH
jgi:hypothetical protein